MAICVSCPAVNGAAEGHTVVALFNVSLILGRSGAEHGSSIAPEVRYDGYPGLVFIEGWRDEWLLIEVVHDDKEVELLMLHPDKGIRPRGRTTHF